MTGLGRTKMKLVQIAEAYNFPALHEGPGTRSLLDNAMYLLLVAPTLAIL